MKGFKNTSEFERLFMEELKGLYWLESHWITTQRELQEFVVSDELRVTLRSHNLLNMEAVLRLEKIFNLMNVNIAHESSRFVDDLIYEIRRKINITREDSMVRDAALIIDVQKVIHFTIAAYGSLATLAQLMNQQEIRDLLQTTLHEKKVNDVELTALAENFTNLKAANE